MGYFLAYFIKDIIATHTKNNNTIPETDSNNDFCALRFLSILSSRELTLSNFKETNKYITRKPNNTSIISVKTTLKKKRNMLGIMFRGLRSTIMGTRYFVAYLTGFRSFDPSILRLRSGRSGRSGRSMFMALTLRPFDYAQGAQGLFRFANCTLPIAYPAFLLFLYPFFSNHCITFSRWSP
jgi:hypothetical protein